RIVKSNSQYGPLTLRIKNGDEVRAVIVPQSKNLEIDDIQIHFIQERPYFLVIDRYKLYMVDMEKKVISPFMQPGLTVEYREDAISGMMDGFRFFDKGNSLVGIVANYGLFCFDVSDLDNPKELQRKAMEPGTGNIAQSDTLKKSRGVTGFYTET